MKRSIGPIVIGMCMALASTPLLRGADDAAGPGNMRPPPAAETAAAREQFLRIERFARLPVAEQAGTFHAFYREDAAKHSSSRSLMILSAIPDDILIATKSGAAPAGDRLAVWGAQLDAAAVEQSPEQVADRLQRRLWLDLASHVRVVQLLKRHATLTETLVSADLQSKEPADFSRGCEVLLALELAQFTPRLLELYLSADARSDRAGEALLWLRDPAIKPALLDAVEKDPQSLARHAGLFQSVLAGEAAEPRLVRLLDSPDVSVRYFAAFALQECVDASLGQRVATLARADELRLKTVGVAMAQKLPPEGFAAAREAILPLLAHDDTALRVAATRAFAVHRDIAAGPVLLGFLRQEGLAPQFQVDVMQSLAALCDTQFGYNMHEWGPGSAQNRAAIAKLEQWLARRVAQ